MPRWRASDSSRSRMLRPTPRPRAVGDTHMRLISPMPGARVLRAPQPVRLPSRRARNRQPLGSVNSPGSGGLSRTASKPPRKRASSSAKYWARHWRASALAGSMRTSSTPEGRRRSTTSGGAAPETFAREPRPRSERLKLHPAERRKHRAEAGKGPESAVASRDDSVFSDDRAVALDTLRHHLRVLDIVGVRADHTGNENLVRRQLDALPDLPLVLVTRIGTFDEERHRLGLEHDRKQAGAVHV